MILRTVRALISLTVRAACKITTSNKPAKSHRDKSKSLYQHMLVFYAVMAAIAFLITWFLSHDKKRIRFLSAFLVGATWPMSFPVALLFSLF